jgi:hypothetical protein
MGGFIRIPPELSTANMMTSSKVLKAVKMGRFRKKAAGKARESLGMRRTYPVRRNDE